MEDNKKKSTKGLYTLIVLQCMIIFTLVGCIVYKEFYKESNNNNQSKLEQKIEELEKKIEQQKETQVVSKCNVTEFNSNYVLTEDDKKELVNQINNHEASGNLKIDIESLKIEKVDSRLIYIQFKDTSHQDTLTAVAYKNDGKMVLITFGSGFLNTEEIEWKNLVNGLCK